MMGGVPMWKGWSAVAVSLWLSVFGISRVLGAEAAGSGPTPYQKNSVVVGQVTATKSCAETSGKRSPEVWLSIGQILLYQVEVPVNGNYEFHVVPGKYDLLVTNSGGCLDQTEIKIASKQVAQVNLRLTSRGR